MWRSLTDPSRAGLRAKAQRTLQMLKQKMRSCMILVPGSGVAEVSFWNPTQTYFIYWQRSMERSEVLWCDWLVTRVTKCQLTCRWAICDSGSYQPAKDGSVPGQNGCMMLYVHCSSASPPDEQTGRMGVQKRFAALRESKRRLDGGADTRLEKKTAESRCYALYNILRNYC